MAEPTDDRAAGPTGRDRCRDPADAARTSRRRAAPPPPRPPAAPAAEVDLGRRRFFRQFAGDIIQTAATMAGAAQALQRASAEAAGALLDPNSGSALAGAPGRARR